MKEYARYLGFDQHKDTIAIAEAQAGREPEIYLGSISNRAEDIRGGCVSAAGHGAVWKMCWSVTRRGHVDMPCIGS